MQPDLGLAGTTEVPSGSWSSTPQEEAGPSLLGTLGSSISNQTYFKDTLMF
jgi:hypothetical protein